MTAIRLRCFPVVPIDPDARNVWVPEGGGTGFYIQDDDNPWLSAIPAFESIKQTMNPKLFKKGRVKHETNTRVYSTLVGYLGIAVETYEVQPDTTSAPSPPALKPCPFCGSTNHVKDGRHVLCEKCLTVGPVVVTHDESTAEAIELWNRRPAEDALREGIRELRDALASAEMCMSRFGIHCLESLADHIVFGNSLEQVRATLKKYPKDLNP